MGASYKEQEEGTGHMKKILERLNIVLEMIFRALQLFSKLVLLAVVFIVSAQVISRKFFHHSIIWSEEVALLLMVWITFISMAIGVAKNIHIRIEMFYNMYPAPVQKLCQWLGYIVALFVGVVLMVYGGKLIRFTLHSTLPTTKWPSFMLYLMSPVGGFYIVYCTILHMFFPDAARIFADSETEETKE